MPVFITIAETGNGILNINYCTISGNTTHWVARAAALTMIGVLTITGSNILNNKGFQGSGIYSRLGTLDISNTVVFQATKRVLVVAVAAASSSTTVQRQLLIPPFLIIRLT